MQSSELVGVLLSLVAELNAGDGEAAARRFSDDADSLVIGTNRDEWLEGPGAIHAAFRQEAGTVQADVGDVRAAEDGDFGWIAARAWFTFGAAEHVPARWTLVMRRTGAGWKIVHSHLSIPYDEPSQ